MHKKNYYVDGKQLNTDKLNLLTMISKTKIDKDAVTVFDVTLSANFLRYK
jgi:hypothetical protein